MVDVVSMGGKAASRAEIRLWRHRRPVLTYVLALAVVTFVFLVRSWLAPTLGNQALYLFLVPPVLAAGIVGGWGRVSRLRLTPWPSNCS